MDPVIELAQVTRVFEGSAAPALHSITARFSAGAITGLAGPDGAGKTTLMRILAGLLAPTSGTVRVLGMDPVSQANVLRERVGYMPQKFGLYEDLSVDENLELHADLRGVVGDERDRTFKRLLAFTDLASFRDRLAGRLSGGMKQKLGLACALLGKPELLLLDEPGVGVDPISRRELWAMVNELVQQGLAVLWSTAYLEEAERCRDVLLLSEGRALYAGPPKNLTRRMDGRCVKVPAGTRKRELLSAALKDPAVMDGAIEGNGFRLVLRSREVQPSFLEWAVLSQQATPSQPRFEDAFVDALGGGPGGESVLSRHAHTVAGARDEAVVIAEELTKKFGTFTATDRVSFSVNRGEIFGLLGPNGAGKSTTFRMMCGLLRPTAGTAQVLGIDLRHSPSKARQKLGYMAQKFSLYGNLTVRQNLDFFSGAYGLRGEGRKQAIAGMVNAFKLEPFLNIAPQSLPLGLKQRLALACAVMHQPDILFLDEPTSGVDPVMRREFWMHINALVAKGVTIIVTTHFMEEAEYCDRIALVSRGRIIASGTPEDLKRLATNPSIPTPSMEDAFIELVKAQPSVEEDRL